MNFATAIFTICFGFTLYADWDPNVLKEPYPNHYERLTQRPFVELKARITNTLAKSWCSAEKTRLLMDLTLVTQPSVCVEIGAFTGSSILPVAATLKYLNSGNVFAIDAWSSEVAIQNLAEDDPNKAWWSKLNMKDIRRSFRAQIKSWALGKYCTEIAKTSESAVQSIPEKIDFLHLDGDYSEKGSLRDVQLYLPKVRSGGYILLSNLYIMINREQPKIKAFCALYEACEVVASIDNDNTVLFRKI